MSSTTISSLTCTKTKENNSHYLIRFSTSGSEHHADTVPCLYTAHFLNDNKTEQIRIVDTVDINTSAQTMTDEQRRWKMTAANRLKRNSQREIKSQGETITVTRTNREQEAQPEIRCLL